MDAAKPFEHRFNQASIQELQHYIRTIIRRASDLNYISQQTLEILKTVHLLHNMAKTYLDPGLSIEELEDRIASNAELERAIVSDQYTTFLNDSTLDQKLRIKLEQGKDLISKFMNAEHNDVDDYFKYFS